MNPAQIKHMVDRFLSWKLPNDFNPDGGVIYDRPRGSHNIPTGTNLLTATQASAMVRHMIEGMPGEVPAPVPIPDRSALGPHGDEEPERVCGAAITTGWMRTCERAPGHTGPCAATPATDEELGLNLVPTPAMEERATEIARKYGGGAIPHYAALAGLMEGSATPEKYVGQPSPGATIPASAREGAFELMPLCKFGGFAAQDAKNYRTAAHEVVMGYEVAAYRETDPEYGDKYGHRYSEHWSTPNSRDARVKVERLFTEAQLRAAIEDKPDAPLTIADVALALAALEPFVSFAGMAVDKDGWKNATGRERIVDWFGPTDFRNLAALARNLGGGK